MSATKTYGLIHQQMYVLSPLLLQWWSQPECIYTDSKKNRCLGDRKAQKQ